MIAANIPAQAERYLRHVGGWVPNHELARHVGVTPHALAVAMKPSVDVNVIERALRGKGPVLYWRITPPAPARIFSIDWPPGFVSQWFTIDQRMEARRR